MTTPSTLDRLARGLPDPDGSTSPTHDFDRLAAATLQRVDRRRRRSHLGFAAALVGAAAVLAGAIGQSGRSATQTTATGSSASSSAQPEAAEAAGSSWEIMGLGGILPTLLRDALPVAGAFVVALVVIAAAVVWFRRRRVARPMGWTKRTLLGLIVAVVGLVAIWNLAFDVYYIPSAAMAPTLDVGDRVIVAQGDTSAELGDIVVFGRQESLPGVWHTLIKRVVAAGGDRVEGRDGLLWVNGEPSPHTPGAMERSIAEFQALDVPDGQLFVIGDNYPGSTDSRVFGPIDEALVRGTVRWVTGGLLVAQP